MMAMKVLAHLIGGKPWQAMMQSSPQAGLKHTKLTILEAMVSTPLDILVMLT